LIYAAQQSFALSKPKPLLRIEDFSDKKNSIGATRPPIMSDVKTRPRCFALADLIGVNPVLGRKLSNSLGLFGRIQGYLKFKLGAVLSSPV
jgi:hypothetical protein